MYDEERWGVTADVGARRRRQSACGLAVPVVAVKADRGADRRVRILKARLKHRIVRRERGHRRQVRARRASGHDQPRGVQTVLGRMLAHPRDHPLGIDQRGREAARPVEPVVRADAHPAPAGEAEEQGPRFAALTAHPEVPAVKMNEHRGAGRTRPVAIQVEPITAPGRPVADVRDPLHAAGSERQGPEHGPCPQTPAHPATDGQARRPAGPEITAQGTREDWACHHRSPRDDHKTTRRKHGDTEHRQPGARAQPLAPEREQRRRHQPAQGKERELVDQVAEPETHRGRRSRAARRRQRGEGDKRDRRHRQDMAHRDGLRSAMSRFMVPSWSSVDRPRIRARAQIHISDLTSRCTSPTAGRRWIGVTARSAVPSSYDEERAKEVDRHAGVPRSYRAGTRER